MRLGYFGGSFDPPHLGHLAVARAAADSFALDEVLFVPTGRQPLKPITPGASFADRLAMATLLCEPHPLRREASESLRFKASALDAPWPDGSANYTVDTLMQLRADLGPGDSIFVVVGADAFFDLRRWREPDRLLTLADWVVVSRPGFSIGRLDALALTPAQRKRVHLLKGISEPASATWVRQQLSSGGGCDGLLTAEVLTYIREHHLYGT
jgi:nicotinate-nucleotide adenylyltransferase